MDSLLCVEKVDKKNPDWLFFPQSRQVACYYFIGNQRKGAINMSERNYTLSEQNHYLLKGMILFCTFSVYAYTQN